MKLPSIAVYFRNDLICAIELSPVSDHKPMTDQSPGTLIWRSSDEAMSLILANLIASFPGIHGHYIRFRGEPVVVDFSNLSHILGQLPEPWRIEIQNLPPAGDRLISVEGLVF